MKKIYLKIFNNSLLSNNILMIGGNATANIGAYLYHFMMGRLLSSADTGALQSLISLINLLSVPIATLNTVVVKYISSYVSKHEYSKVSYLYHLLKRAFIINFIVGGGIFLFFQRFVLAFLHIDSSSSFIALDLMIFSGFLQFLNRATLHGYSDFLSLIITQFIESYGKLILGVIFVVMGFRYTGAFWAFILAGLIGYIYTSFVVQKLIPSKEKSISINLKPFVAMSIPSFFMTIGIMSLFNTDLILVRHFLSAHESGLYSALSIYGKIIFFGTAPIANVMLPSVSGAHAKGESYNKIFLLSVLFTFGFSFVVISLFAINSSFFLQALGSQYSGSEKFLVLYSIFISLCALINLFVLFFYTIHRMLPTVMLVIGALIQLSLIVWLHDALADIIKISLGVTASLFGMLLLYYIYVTRKRIIFYYRSSLSSGKKY